MYILYLYTYLNGLALGHSASLEPLSRHRGRGDGAATAEGLELGVDDPAAVVHFELQFHHVSAGRGAH